MAGRMNICLLTTSLQISEFEARVTSKEWNVIWVGMGFKGESHGSQALFLTFYLLIL